MDEDRWYFSFLQGINLLKIKFPYGNEHKENFLASMITKDKDHLSNFLGEL